MILGKTWRRRPSSSLVVESSWLKISVRHLFMAQTHFCYNLTMAISVYDYMPFKTIVETCV